jgi:cardiolipin synthase
MAALAEPQTGLNLKPGSSDDGWVMPQPVVLSDGSRIQLYKDGQALHAAYEAIRHAKRRICLEVYIFSSDATGRAFADLLAKKASEGVAVYVMIDGWGSFDCDADMYCKMQRAGVRFEWFHPVRPWHVKFGWRPFLRDHRKMLVVDDDIAGLGGLNIADEYAGPWVVDPDKKDSEYWRDNAIGVVGPAARLLLRSFARTWNYLTHGGRIRTAEYKVGVDEEQQEFGILASVPTAHSPLRPLLHRLLQRARRSIDLTMAYFAPDDDLVAEICSAARRGVRVRLMLPARSDLRILVTAARFFYQRLDCAGVQIYERQHVVLHAKTMCVDEEVSVIGSSNLDYRSIEYNLELSAIIRSPALGRLVVALFENDIQFARRITASEIRRRPWIDRLGQWAVSRARYLL